MIYEIVNKKRSPAQLIVRTKRPVQGAGSRGFTTLNLPGIGANKNVIRLPEERFADCEHYLEDLEKKKWIKVNKIPEKFNKNGDEGE